eukprot:CAMPEP_0175074182 /NCGR_PEP_ID=MMETSP0052_2-20121109/21124_1 /TAXON_ID=51329 ORGANISM="Polytomella parva, Strain SAG 63-3" /NCGR_SAMPLE_ID=MMETSP0052_2 /ASSEMBLY_ACC=CAM_ASM_000194 /LENGTH=40 /DNA_ID= /DNA_START= /DNA_END= /DNA_ORIENTATION=
MIATIVILAIKKVRSITNGVYCPFPPAKTTITTVEMEAVI